MGLLDRFRRRPAPPVHTVWATAAARDHAVFERLRELRTDSRPVVLLTHFAATAAAWCEALREADDVYRLAESPEDVAAGGLTVMHSELLTGNPAGRAPAHGFTPAAVLVAEAHCLPGPPAAVDAWAAAVGWPAPRHHVALDGPLLTQFFAPGRRGVFDALGVTEATPTSARMLDRSIRRAQEKIAALVTAPRDAESQADWLRLNLPAPAERRADPETKAADDPDGSVGASVRDFEAMR